MKDLERMFFFSFHAIGLACLCGWLFEGERSVEECEDVPKLLYADQNQDLSSYAVQTNNNP